MSNLITFVKLGPLPTSNMKLFVTVVDCWKLLTSIASSLDLPLLSYDPQTAAYMVYVDDGRPLLVFIPNPKCNQDFNETILKVLACRKKS